MRSLFPTPPTPPVPPFWGLTIVQANMEKLAPQVLEDANGCAVLAHAAAAVGASEELRTAAVACAVAALAHHAATVDVVCQAMTLTTLSFFSAFSLGPKGGKICAATSCFVDALIFHRYGDKCGQMSLVDH